MAFRLVALLAALIALAFSASIFLRGLHLPLLEDHAFRQTQTALTVYWLQHGGGWLNYELPVLGSPWSIPMEFPIYQWIVALVGQVAPAHLDQVGRTVSYLFHLLTLIPLYSLCRRHQAGWEAFPVSMALFLMAPVYLFWSRTFMIESTALFFALAFVSLYSRWVRSGEWWVGAAAAMTGMAGILQKVTTFLPFLLLASAVTVPPAMALARAHQWKEFARRGLGAVVIIGLPTISLMVWVNHSDRVKSLHPIANHLTKAGLSRWNFGTLAQRLSDDLWVRVIGGRAVPEAVGGSVVLVLGLALAAFMTRRAHLTIAVLSVAYLVSIMTFTNLHIVHNYYQCANAILLIALVGVIVAEAGKSHPRSASLLLVLVMVMQWQVYRASYRPKLKADYAQARTVLLANFIREATPRESAILVLGLDWSSEIAYYAERKSLTLPSWASRDVARRVLESPSAFTVPLPVSAVVACWDHMPGGYKDLAWKATTWLPMWRATKIGSCDIFLTRNAGDPRPPRLVEIGPARIRTGEAFNVQPDGSATLWATTEEATPTSVIVWGERRLSTVFISSGQLTAQVPRELYAKSGHYDVHVLDTKTNAPSNYLIVAVESAEIAHENFLPRAAQSPSAE